MKKSNNEKKKLLISFSGGRTSAYMTWWLLKNKQEEYEMIVVFANTGKEREETLQFVHKCDVEFGFNTIWIEAKVDFTKGVGTSFSIVDFDSACRDGRVYEEHIKKYGLPNQNAPQCTRELKAIPIDKFAKSIGWKKYETALGIRSDEPKRLDWEKKVKKKALYFAELFHVTKSDVNLFWSKQSFDLELKSYEGNCDLCFKKGLRKLMTIAKNNPELTDWWKDMEQKYELHDPRNAEKTPYRFFRDNMTMNDIIEESQIPFEEAKDESKTIADARQMSLWDEYLDSNNGCTETCEVF
jgi:3'-phosphoadenosine 5'-phosphosulfate sulfotransferase (PAPS reductase)/FAD synthetase